MILYFNSLILYRIVDGIFAQFIHPGPFHENLHNIDLLSGWKRWISSMYKTRIFKNQEKYLFKLAYIFSKANLFYFEGQSDFKLSGIIPLAVSYLDHLISWASLL